MPKHGLSEEEVKLVHSSARRVWDNIGWDCFEEVSSMPRSHVIEVVCDAGRLEQTIRAKSPALADKIEKMDYKVLVALLKPAFPFARYGR